MVNSYFFNKFWTFQKKKVFTAGEVVKFIFVNFMLLRRISLVLYVLQSKGGWKFASKVFGYWLLGGVNF
jgi:putative flippase GtrA